MRQLDRGRPYAGVWPPYGDPAVWFEQDGMQFDFHGNLVGEEIADARGPAAAQDVPAQKAETARRKKVDIVELAAGDPQLLSQLEGE